MGLFKKTIALSDLILKLVNSILDGEYPQVKDVDSDNILSDKEIAKIESRLRGYSLVLLTFWLFKIQREGKIANMPTSMSPEESSYEITKLFVLILAKAYKQRYESKKTVIKKIDEYTDLFEEYMEALEKAGDKQIKEKGEFFFLVSHFADSIFPEISTDNARDKNYIAFDTAKQFHRRWTKVWDSITGEYKF